MPVDVIRHVPFEGLGLIEPVLKRHELPIRWHEIGDTLTDPELATSQALILMGGPMSANDPDPWVGTEIDLIQRALARQIPILGVCLGAQLIARTLGSRVYRNPVKEIGWYPTYWTDAGRIDPVFGGLPDGVNIFQWHGETFDIPPGAEWLAYTKTCAYQAFRAGPNVYGIQFHPEVTPEIIEDWISQDANCGDVRELEHQVDPWLHSQSQAELTALVFERWAQQVVLPTKYSVKALTHELR
jgi:GMP synthase-like glutamine amidotransferase